jgi:enoyl-CoA hydratase/carnithine racemase
LFMALTGAQLRAADCQLLGLADYTLDSSQWEALLAGIRGSSWSENRLENDSGLRRLLLGLQAAEPAPPGPLQKHHALIRRACDGSDLEGICANVAALAEHDDAWLKRAAATFQAGSPGSARLSFTLLDRARLMALPDVFRLEYIVSLQCGVQGDLREGIRALLIDKDRQPKWNPASLQQASDAWVQRFFKAPWPDTMTHPLADLGQP